MTGLLFSTRARSIALGAIAVLVAVQNWEAGAAATLYFEVIIALFFVLGSAINGWRNHALPTRHSNIYSPRRMFFCLLW